MLFRTNMGWLQTLNELKTRDSIRKEEGKKKAMEMGKGTREQNLANLGAMGFRIYGPWNPKSKRASKVQKPSRAGTTPINQSFDGESTTNGRDGPDDVGPWPGNT